MLGNIGRDLLDGCGGLGSAAHSADDAGLLAWCSPLICSSMRRAGP
jgi:hypothetical protein